MKNILPNNELRIYNKRVGYNPKAFSESDLICKRAAIRHFRLEGWDARDNTLLDKYAVDLKVYHPTRNDIIWDVELELRAQYFKGIKFPFKTVHIPYRKGKFIDAAERFGYIVINNNQSYFLICRDKEVIENAEIVRIKTPRMKKEPFYNVPLEFFELRKIRIN